MTLALTGTAGAPVGVIAFGPQTRSLTLAGTTDAPRGFITLNGDRCAAVLYDAGNNWLAPLPLAAGIKYQRSLSDPGMVSFRIRLDDAASALAVPGTFVKVFRNGKIRQAAEITDEGVDLSIDGKPWRSFDNLPGVLNLTSKGCVWPEYGTDRTYSSSRTFGYMSALGAWYRSGNWTRCIGFRYRDDTGFRQLKPAGLSFPNPYWVSKYGPYVKRPPGSVEWIRHHFTTYGDDLTEQLLATGDDLVEAWLDGERVISPDMSQTDRWRSLVQYTSNLPAGLHVLAFKIRNGRKNPNAMALIATIQQLKKTGDVVDGQPLANSSPYWFASDVLPGFRKADVITRCVFENRNLHSIPAFDLIRLDFTPDTGTDGVPFTDDPEQHTRPVGEDLLTMIQAFCEKHLDAAVEPDRFKLQLWHRKGSDKRATVIIRRGQADVGSLVEGAVQRQAPRFTVVLVQLGDQTWVEFADDDLVAAWGRVVTTVSAGDANTSSKAQTIAEGMFREQARSAVAITATVTGLDGPQFEKDFHEGDTIGVEDENLDVQPMRVLSGLVDGDRDATPMVELELMLDLSS